MTLGQHQPHPQHRRPETDEEQIDRRAHWVQWAITGIIIATAWCVRLEFTVAGLKAEMEAQKQARDNSIAQIWTRFGTDHDTLAKLQQWKEDQRR